MGTLKIKQPDSEPSGREIERSDHILAEVRRARIELEKEIAQDAERVHQRALRHAKELGFNISNRKPVKPQQAKKR